MLRLPLALTLLLTIASAAALLDVALLPSTTRYDVYAPVTSGGGPLLNASIAVAGREREAVQVLVRATTNTTLVVTLDPPASLPAGSLQLHRAGMVWASNATDVTRVFNVTCPESVRQREGGCWVADPLLPLIPTTPGGQEFRVPITAGFTTSLWVTLLGPVDVATYAGMHSAALRLSEATATGQKAAATTTVALSLKVRRFALPLAPRLRTAIELTVAHLQRCFPGDTTGAQTEARYLRYAEFLLRELRLNPGSFYDSWGPDDGSRCDYNAYKGCYVPTAGDLKRWVDELGLNAFSVPWGGGAGGLPAGAKAVPNRTAAFVEQLRARNISQLANFYGFDEYNGNMSAVGEAFAQLKASFPEITTLTTAHIGSQFPMVPDNLRVPLTAATMAELSVDAVTPQTNYMPPLANRTEVQRAGRQLWTYISLQPYNGYANWRLDNPLVDGRTLLWQVAAYGFDGLLYWGFNQWQGSTKPIDAATSDGFIPAGEWQIFNTVGEWIQGDGKLLYCGDENTTGPISSMRLANVRDGTEDYDYLAILRDLDADAADAALERMGLLGAGTGDANEPKPLWAPQRNASLLRLVREDVANVIEHCAMAR